MYDQDDQDFQKFQQIQLKIQKDQQYYSQDGQNQQVELKVFDKRQNNFHNLNEDVINKSKKQEEQEFQFSEEDDFNLQLKDKGVLDQKIKWGIIVFLSIFVILEQVYSKELQEGNKEWTISIQKSMQNSIGFFKFLSYFVEFEVVAFLLVLSFEFSHKKAQFISCIYLVVFVNSLNSFLKLCYAQPRPFQQFQEIESFMCSNDFGNPSGHTMVGSVLYNVLVYYWFYERQKNWLVKIILVVLVSGWNILIGFDRIILGEHSFSQVILGWVYAGIVFLIFQQRFLRWTKLNIQVVNNLEQNDYNKNYSLLTGSFYVFFNVACIIVFEVQKNKLYYEETLLIYQKCQFNFNKDNRKFLFNKNFLDSAQITLSVSLLFFLHKISVHYQTKEYNKNLWKYNSQKLTLQQRATRFLLEILAVVIPYIIFSLIPYGNNQNEIYIRYFFRDHLQAFCMAFCLAITISKGFKFLKVDIQGDFLRIPDTKQINQ